MNPITPNTILELARNFMETRIFLTGAELNLFTLLASNPLSAEEITVRIKGDLRTLTILLDALTAMDLLVKQAGKYYCPPLISSLLSKNSPDSVLPMVHHMVHLWQRWSDLTRIVCSSASVTEAASPQAKKEEELRDFIGAMHTIAAKLAPAIVTAVNPGQAKTLLDVGGASGTYTLAFLQAAPQMKGTLFDKPEVVEMARKRLGEAGALDRVSLVGGDFYGDEFPPGHDLAFVSAIIHQNSPAQNLDLYRKIFRSLNPGGRIIIRDHVMEPDRTRPKDGAIFAVNMLVGTSGGNTYTYEEIRSGLAQAGFFRIRLLQKGEHMDGLVEGFKPN
jgi:predicted O-methyltransferase YrrM